MKTAIAAVQMESRNGDFDGNRKRAEDGIIEAINKGARLISLPEFALVGYTFTDSIWEMAEPLRGRTYDWLAGLCDKHDVFITTCILERDGDDFFDTLILCGPNGGLWSHRKVEPASYEAFFFKGAGQNPNTFDTPIGKVGVVICFDTSKTYSVKSLIENRPDLLLLQYSCPEWPPFAPKGDRTNWVETYKDAPRLYAKQLGVPVLSCNKTGAFSTTIPFGFGIKYSCNFVDHSTILDANGEPIAEISKRAGVICAEVELGSNDNIPIGRIPKGRWFLPYSLSTRLATEYSQKIGKARYRLSKKRKLAALCRNDSRDN